MFIVFIQKVEVFTFVFERVQIYFSNLSLYPLIIQL